MVDGNDVEETRRVALALIEQIRRGEGPFLVEALTYRIRGHYVGDPEATYRSRQEVDAWREKEPLKRAQEKLLQSGLPPAALEEMDQATKDRMETLQAWALAQEFPSLEQAIDHVYVAFADGRNACQ